MTRINRSREIENALLQAVSIHPRDLVVAVATRLGLSAARIGNQVRAMIAAGYLNTTGSTRPIYTLGRNRHFEQSYPHEGLAEDGIWIVHLRHLLGDLPPNVLGIAHHGVTEILNNAIDHSGATQITVRMDLRDGRLLLAIADDGVGIFRKIARALDLPDERWAPLELSKGKFTTDPNNHTGEGVFFAARMFDMFRIASGGLVFEHAEGRRDDMPLAIGDASRMGTSVYMAIDSASQRTLDQVFDEYFGGPQGHVFDKTVIPVRLAHIGGRNPVLRMQAACLLRRLEQFRRVTLDFADVCEIGAEFADEVFCVFARAHPEVELAVIHALPEVLQTIRRVEIEHGWNGRDRAG